MISILKTRLISVPVVRYEECQAFVAECQSEGRPRGGKTNKEGKLATNKYVCKQQKGKILQDEQPKYSMNSKVVQDGTIPLPPQVDLRIQEVILNLSFVHCPEISHEV